MADLCSLVVEETGAWLQKNVEWPTGDSSFYTDILFRRSRDAKPVRVDVPSAGLMGPGLVATDLVVTDVWTGCPHHRHPSPDHGRLACYVTVRATSGRILGERFDRPDGVFIEIRAPNPDRPTTYPPKNEIDVIFDAPPEGTQRCHCARQEAAGAHPSPQCPPSQ